MKTDSLDTFESAKREEPRGAMAIRKGGEPSWDSNFMVAFLNCYNRKDVINWMINHISNTYLVIGLNEANIKHLLTSRGISMYGDTTKQRIVILTNMTEWEPTWTDQLVTIKGPMASHNLIKRFYFRHHMKQGQALMWVIPIHMMMTSVISHIHISSLPLYYV